MKNLNLDVSASGELIAAPDSPMFIAVLGLDINLASAVKVTLLSGGSGGTAKHTFTGTAANLDDTLPISPECWFACVPGENLYMTLGSGVNVTGSIRYAIKG